MSESPAPPPAHLPDRDAWLQAALRRPAPAVDVESVARISFFPVDGGSHRILRIPGDGARRVVFLPGWGATILGWQDFYAMLHGRVELIIIETLEKSTTPIDPAWPDRSVRQMARNTAKTIASLELDDYVLLGSCWGASVLLEGLLDGQFTDAPTLVAYDPMHAMWFSPALLKYVAPLLPVPLINAARKLIQTLALRGMDQPVQRQRAEAFIAAADAARWKRFAIAAADFELFGRLGGIEREVLVFNGSHDHVHDRDNYPKIAAELPRGRFFFMEVGEADRERLAAVIALALAETPASPASLDAFEVPVR